MSAIEQCVGEDGDVFCGGEEAGVSGYAAENAGVFVLDFALDYSAAKFVWLGGVCDPRAGAPASHSSDFGFVGSGDDFVFPGFRWIECGVGHA